MRNNFLNPSFKFAQEPVEFDKLTDKTLLQYCLGGTLYMPGTKRITEKVLDRSLHGLASMVMCFEDAIQEEMLDVAEQNVLAHLSALSAALESGDIALGEIPLTFLRVRSVAQFRRFSAKLDSQTARVLTGFVFPKFTGTTASEYLQILSGINHLTDDVLYGMPILEGKEIAYVETRGSEIDELRTLLAPYRHLILNIRVGGTDFSSLFGVRRGINSSIYDILPVRDCLSDILNAFNREDDLYTVSAPVWEYFLADKQEDLHDLLEGAFHRTLLNLNTIINPAIDGLLREVVMDIANGFVGKTIIHPSHLRFVNAMQAVTREEYEDARQILDTPGGVVKSSKSNKMNEINPHRNWAKRTSLRAAAYGVVEDESSYLQLMKHETKRLESEE